MSTFDNACLQRFAFQKPIMDYIIYTVKGKTLKKLHKACKYFYIKNKKTILDKLSFFDDLPINEKDIHQYMIRMSTLQEDLNLLKNNLILIGRLWFFGSQPPSKIISKIVECDLYELFIECRITMEELIFLTKSGNITNLVLEEKVYYSGKFTPFPPEQIFALVPKANCFNLTNNTFTEETLKKFLKFEGRPKLEQLLWEMIDQPIDVNLLCLFLEKNLDSKAKVHVSLQDQQMQDVFAAAFYEKINAWKPNERKPRNFPSPFPFYEEQNNP